MVNTNIASVKFKGRMLIFTVLEIYASEIADIAAGIQAQTQQNPGLFYDMPVLLSLQNVTVDLGQVKQLLMDAGLVPVGVLDADESTRFAARKVGLGTVTSPSGSRSKEIVPARRRPAPTAAKATAQAAKPETISGYTPTRFIDRPVRSGQQVYARGGDLIITSSVGEGAEVIADGHIHIYGTLRGRALAGALGDTQARIFCHNFNPDLVAIAGCYKVADAISDRLLGSSVQVRWQNETLLIEPQE